MPDFTKMETNTNEETIENKEPITTTTEHTPIKWTLKAIGYFIFFGFLLSILSAFIYNSGAKGSLTAFVETIIDLMPYVLIPVAFLSIGFTLQDKNQSQENRSSSKIFVWIAIVLFIPLCLVLFYLTAILS